MFFIISKTISFLFMPITLIIGSLLLAQFLKNTYWKKRLTFFGLGLLLLSSNSFFTNTVMKWWEVPATPIENLPAKKRVAIVLTGVTKLEKLPRDRVYFAAGADRVTHAIQLYHQGLVQKIVISGGTGNLFNQELKEATQLLQVFMMCGLPREDLIIESESRNTRESALAVSKILSYQEPDTEYLLITSGFHMRRALACFNRAGLPVQAFSTDFKTSDGPVNLYHFIRPNPTGLYTMQLLTKELMGFTAYKFAGYI